MSDLCIVCKEQSSKKGIDICADCEKLLGFEIDSCDICEGDDGVFYTDFCFKCNPCQPKTLHEALTICNRCCYMPSPKPGKACKDCVVAGLDPNY